MIKACSEKLRPSEINLALLRIAALGFNLSKEGNELIVGFYIMNLCTIVLIANVVEGLRSMNGVYDEKPSLERYFKIPLFQNWEKLILIKCG